MSGTRAEIAKLARLLGEPATRFGYLSALSPEDVRAVRDQAAEVLFGANRALFERIGQASRLVPAALTASIAQRSFGPLLSARVAGALDPDRAVDLAGRLPVSFLADVAAELDPRRIAPVLGVLPIAKVIEVGRELIRRGDHITTGRFVGDLPAPTLRAMVTALDEESLLRTAIYTDSTARLPALFALIPDDRLPAIATTIATATGEFAEDVLPLLLHLDTPSLTRLATAIRTLPESERDQLATTARALGVLDALGPIADALT
ncbi:hypothetical protein [Actinokineospora globicatena]|uniref:hypothetical protein n=1 Tax=Actinokineospora globicatena TaxID=103729 RepID=UPI0020A3FF04|nr:hypothetical protein [Actinokineospora globicatena]MCP2304701.1 hypothetical protein [Actinokineospora globicatena]GLW77924.1 hypothetical protein Aglo01_24060 [Actinokineospora globicatena]GLW85409.1 hypothetical protein Aglo02_30490 [Actinokineospora globicatena]